MKKTPLGKGKNYKGLKKTNSLKNTVSLKKTGGLKKSGTLKKTGTLAKTYSLKHTELKQQNDEAKEKWIEARNKCLERDNHKCQLCGKPATQVHHIHLRSKRKDLLYVLSNLISLCDKCHCHHGSENYLYLTQRIADSKHISIDQLLKEAENG